MALSLSSRATKRADQLLSVDLGGRTTKAVNLQRKGDKFVLSRYAVLDAPIYERTLSAEVLTEHLKQVYQAVDARTRTVSLAIGVNDSLVRHADLPPMPANDMRQVLKNNSKSYLQQDLPGHLFDCFVFPPRAQAKPAAKPATAGGNPKQRVLVAGARKQLVDDMQTAIRDAGLVADHIVPGLLGPVNAFELAMPEVFAQGVVALVDIGFKNTSICLLQQGELMLSRVLAIGGDKLSNGLAEALGISYAEAESIKVGMPAEVQSHLETLVIPLGRELRASIDFFEHQHDTVVTQVYLSGGSTASPIILQTLQAELLLECKVWNPLSFLERALPPQQEAEIDRFSSQLTVAVGAAVGAF